MKICLLSRYFDFRNAGVGRVGLQIRRELEKRGHEVTVVSTDGTSLYSYFWYTGVEMPFRLRFLPNADIYHAITPMEAMWLPKWKSVVTFHDLFQLTDKDKLGSGMGYSRWKTLVGSLYYRMACAAARRCKRIVAVSSKTRNDLVQVLGVEADRIKVITSGIRSDLDFVSNNDFRSRVGYLGQLDRRKRLPLLIDAFRTGTLDELVVGGTGVDADLLKSRASGDLRIRFVGYVPDEHLMYFYNSLDALIFPTWMEGYGLPIVEAMACKKPVIVLADADLPQEVETRCAVVDNLSDALRDADSLERVCKQVDIEDNYRWAKTHTWERTVDEYLKVYEEVLNG